MMLSISAPTMAQTDKAQFDAIAKTIVDKNGDAAALKDDIKAFTKLYKKNPEAMANIGRAFLEVDNYEKANEYADLPAGHHLRQGRPHGLREVRSRLPEG